MFNLAVGGNTVMYEGYVSIIIPVYNVETYLEECLESVISQTYEKMEIILVDDGSTDSSGIICDTYGKKDSRITVVHKDNGGVALARNVGLNMCNGEFICFIDSDDYVEADMCQNMVEALQNSKADMASFSYKIIDCENNENPISPQPVVISSKDFMDKIMRGENRYANYAVWSRLYYASTLKSIRFENGIRKGEDVIFTLEVLSTVRTCVCSELVIYNYRIVRNSISHSAYVYFPDRLIVKNREIEILATNGLNEHAQKKKISFSKILLLYWTKTKDKRDKRLIEYYLESNRLSVTEIIKSKMATIFKIEAISVMKFPTLCRQYYKIKCRKEKIDII